jgi:hypothetical protein
MRGPLVVQNQIGDEPFARVTVPKRKPAEVSLV